MFNNSKSKCALINAPCPKTADETAPIYCPNWVENIPEVEKDGSGRVTAQVFYTGCQLRRQVLYMLSITAGTGQAAASADKSATESLHCKESIQQLVSLSNTVVLMELVSKSLAEQATSQRVIEDATRGELTA